MATNSNAQIGGYHKISQSFDQRPQSAAFSQIKQGNNNIRNLNETLNTRYNVEPSNTIRTDSLFTKVLLQLRAGFPRAPMEQKGLIQQRDELLSSSAKPFEVPNKQDFKSPSKQISTAAKSSVFDINRNSIFTQSLRPRTAYLNKNVSAMLSTQASAQGFINDLPPSVILENYGKKTINTKFRLRNDFKAGQSAVDLGNSKQFDNLSLPNGPKHQRIVSAINESTKRHRRLVSENENLIGKKMHPTVRQNLVYQKDEAEPRTTKEFLDLQSTAMTGDWAMKQYVTPLTITSFHNKPQEVMKFQQHSDKINFFEKHAKKKQAIPPSWKYTHTLDWRKENEHDNLQRFLKQKRMTPSDVILEKKKLKEPGPSTYKINNELVEVRSQKPSKIDSPQIQLFDHMKIMSKQVPAAIYKVEESYKVIESRSMKTLIYPRDRPKTGEVRGSRGGSHAHQIKKTKDPGPGSYEKVELGLDKYLKTRTDTVAQFAKPRLEKSVAPSKEGKHTFIDTILKNSKYTPGVGNYKKKESAQDFSISKPLATLSRKR